MEKQKSLIDGAGVTSKEIDAMTLSFFMQLVSLYKNLNSVEEELKHKNSMSQERIDQLTATKKELQEYIRNIEYSVEAVVLTLAVEKFDKIYNENGWVDLKKLPGGRAKIIEQLNKLSNAAVNKISKTMSKKNAVETKVINLNERDKQ